jgi:hypothetical protein
LHAEPVGELYLEAGEQCRKLGLVEDAHHRSSRSGREFLVRWERGESRGKEGKIGSADFGAIDERTGFGSCCQQTQANE